MLFRSTGALAAGLGSGAFWAALESGGAGVGATLDVKAAESGEGILTETSWPGALGSESSTIGSTTMMAVTSTTAPIRRRRARRLSCSSSSLIARAICRR